MPEVESQPKTFQEWAMQLLANGATWEEVIKKASEFTAATKPPKPAAAAKPLTRSQQDAAWYEANQDEYDKFMLGGGKSKSTKEPPDIAGDFDKRFSGKEAKWQTGFDKFSDNELNEGKDYPIAQPNALTDFMAIDAPRAGRYGLDTDSIQTNLGIKYPSLIPMDEQASATPQFQGASSSYFSPSNDAPLVAWAEQNITDWQGLSPEVKQQILDQRRRELGQ